jgi:uncharacterized protein (TIGR03083 family)
MPGPEVTPTPAPGTPDGLLTEVCDALHGELAALAPQMWRTTVGASTIHDLVAHLAVVNAVLVQRLQARDVSPLDHGELTEITQVPQRELSDAPSADVLDAWLRSVEELRAVTSQYDGAVGWIGLTVPASAAVVDRAFETWIHGNDIRNAIGRASLDPSAQHLRVLVELAVQLLPLALAVTGRAYKGTLNLALSGAGGGEWTVPLGGDESAEHAIYLCASARDLCLLMGDRIDPRDFSYSARGGNDAAAIAADVVAVANVFARP